MYLNFHDTKNEVLDLDDKALIRLVYISQPTIKSRFDSSLFDDIQATSQRYNRQNEITGILCYGNGYFLQLLEGRKEAVLPLMERIFDDPRHKNVNVMFITPAVDYKFNDWQMRSLSLDPRLWTDRCVQTKITELTDYLPFTPIDWTTHKVNEFLKVMRKFDTRSNTDNEHITFNEVGSIIGYTLSRHQAFLVVQGILAVLAICTLLWFF